MTRRNRLRAIILGIFDKRQHNRQYMRLIWRYLPGQSLKKWIERNYSYLKINTANLAAYRGHLYVIKYMAENGIHCTNVGVDWAAENGHLHIVKYLYSQGIYCTNFGYYFAKRNSIDVLQFLEEHQDLMIKMFKYE